MALRRGAVALVCALLVARTAAYTVDCNPEYTDCDNELSKFEADADELVTGRILPALVTSPPEISTVKVLPTRSAATVPSITTESTKKYESKTEDDLETTESPKPKPRLLNLDIDDLQTMAHMLHNQTDQRSHKKHLTDLSDVTLDDDEEEPKLQSEAKKQIDNFYANLASPYDPVLVGGSSGIDICKENEATYKVGDTIERGCEETCECTSGGVFECSPRCKHPYVRRGRKLNDPLCFDSPVDDCCSIIACATGNGDLKPTKLEVCRYGNDTHLVGAQWHIGCEQTCTCQKNSVVSCKPRCDRRPPSDKCINVQDPKDVCCEVQVCDVSQDVHEEPENITTSTSTTEASKSSVGPIILPLKSTMRPLVLSEPIGSVKVLQNNTVQVNLIHMNNTQDPIHLMLSNDNGKTFRDIELKYSNLILNLEGGKDYILKTKETGTKFNFTITATDSQVNDVEENDHGSKVGCYHDGQFYSIGEEFHIGCTELCECTGADTRECAALMCPSHVGLELVSKGCVRWAPSPPATPPNCCPRSARCLSDGTCHYKGIAVPNWSEVPIEMTGCEQRCFCENGDLDCQETCTPLPPLPPQTLRCPPMHRPAPVNISDDDCCKQWGCLPNATSSNKMTNRFHLMTPQNYVTPIISVIPTMATSVLATPPMTTDPSQFYRHLSPMKIIPNFYKQTPQKKHDSDKFSTDIQLQTNGNNITVIPLSNPDLPIKFHPGHSLTVHTWNKPTVNLPNFNKLENPKISGHPDRVKQAYPDSFNTYESSDKVMHDIIQNYPKATSFTNHETLRKVPMSSMDQFNYFLPVAENKPKTVSYQNIDVEPTWSPNKYADKYFEPMLNKSTMPFRFQEIDRNHNREHPQPSSIGKHVTILRNNDLRQLKQSDDPLRTADIINHLLIKAPNPYETVLLRPVPSAKTESMLNLVQNSKNPQLAGKTYSTLDLERILNQMEIESEVNRNLGRSADKNRDSRVSGQSPSTSYTSITPQTPQQPGFLPTIPPENYPREDIADYDQNKIHHPVNVLPGLPPGIHLPPNYGEANKKLSVISLQSDSPTSVMMLFGLPPVLVGLRGSVDLRYTDKAEEDISRWYSQVFAPADEVLTTPRLEFRLTGLKPSTTYKLRGKLYLHNLPVEPESEIYTVRTQDLPTVAPLEEKLREVDSRLAVVNSNDTTAQVSWRHFSEEELQYIDGIQVRYRPVGTPIYSMTELLHHGRSAAELRELRPGSRYEASLVLVPPPRAAVELRDPAVVHFTTAPHIDPYNWTVTIEARAIGSEAAELTWRGVPSPAERWVRVYRAAHACGDQASRKEHDAFRLAARDLPPAVTLTGLEPNTKCRVWLELFLTNGKVKTSNVLEINTKSLDSPEPIDNEIEVASSSIAGSRGDSRGDYYGALVIVGVVAALGALISLLLLLVVIRRHRPRSVPITSVPSAPRESSLPPYDNPAYKLELQQETMDL